MTRRATPRARQIAGFSLALGALMLGCQAEEARLIAGDGSPARVSSAAVTSPSVTTPAASAELVGACVDYVGVMAMAGDGFAAAIVDQAGGADGLASWCEATAIMDPASLRRMGKELSAMEQLAAGATPTSSTLPVVPPTAPPPTTVPPTTLPPPTLPPTTLPPAPTTLPPLVILGEGCDPNYTGACVPIAVDVDCAGKGGNGPVYVVGPVRVVGEDIYGLDGDRDRTGCE